MSDDSVSMSVEERAEQYGPVCSYCGYREAHHPVEYSEYYEKDGILCNEVQRNSE